MNHTTEARQTLNALAARQEALVMRVERQADAQRCVWQPTPNVWSIAQVMQHVGLSAQAMLQSARLAKQRGSRAKFLLMRAVLKSPARVKLPPGVPIAPTQEVSWEDAVALARTSLQAWSAHLETAREGVVFMHPFAGALTATQTMTFLRDHFEHHVRQVERLLADLQRRPAEMV